MMRKTYRTLGTGLTLLCLGAATAAAQNTIDQIATITATAPGSGMFAAGPAGARRNGAAAPVAPALVRSEARSLAIGSPAQQLVGAVLSGGSTTALGSSLTGGGAPAAEAGALMTWLSALAYSPTLASLNAAIQSYNALVKAAPNAFVNNPPEQFLAIRSALIAIWAAR